ncbi:MAG: aminodeoxychorismate lyase [Draconibacterium sp.]|nr:MAG: aminodeoxychorismate lyase [Draconibacterium sp.]
MAINQKNKSMLLPKVGKYVIIFVSIAFIITAIWGYRLYQYVFSGNIKKEFALVIPPDASYQQVTDSLKLHDLLLNYKAFHWVAKKKNYPSHLKPGQYLLKKGMSTNQVVNMLRSGQQTPVNVTFNNCRFDNDLAGKVSKYIMADSVSLLRLFSDRQQIEKYGFTPDNYRSMFIPNTYEFYWTTTADEFADRMKKEYDRFWTPERLQKADNMNLTPIQVSILASIVQSETAKKEEMNRIAGLYFNRLKKGILLQADPTIKYAVGDFTLKRILNSHLTIDSPYNTYIHVGLPPGPINFPETATIDAVLNYEKHDYLYMCAKEDFSGYHNFARTLAEHGRYAARYQAALNAKRIWR